MTVRALGFVLVLLGVAAAVIVGRMLEHVVAALPI